MEKVKHQGQPGSSKLAYSAYKRRKVPAPDDLITRTDPGTPLGEYMRRFWQPVCMSDQLGDVPKKIRVMGEDLIAFRDKSGDVGVHQRHCAHRGASLEYGIIGDHGIRCPYHGFHYDVDGTLLGAPGEKDNGARLSKTVCQGSYPAFERDGLVFAYMGPPEDRPPFPEWDAFANVYPCNFLQVLDNIADQVHTSILHNPKILFDGEPPEDLDIDGFTLAAFAGVPVLDFSEVRDKTSMTFIAGRRMSDDYVWWRMNECIVPNITAHAYLFEDGMTPKKFHRVSMWRWYLPVDDTHSIIFGWRMLGPVADPLGAGNEDQIGWEKNDFLGGQVKNRPYEEQVRLPGDWEVIVGQRPIAIHALENPMAADAGVYMFRKLLRDAVEEKSPGADPEVMHERSQKGLKTHSYTHNSVLKIKRLPNEDEDQALIRKLGKQILKIIEDGDKFNDTERDEFIKGKMTELEASYG
jgi:nitrite reductase/ring-hydroxylating ferredoxin subunit